MIDPGSETNSDRTFSHSPTSPNIEQSSTSKFTSVTSGKNTDSSFNKQQMTKQIEAQHHLSYSSDNPRPNIDKDQSSPLKCK